MDRCPYCGTCTTPPAQFCHECGRSLVGLEAGADDAFDYAALDRLRAERARLSRELTALRRLSLERQLTSAERRSWDHLLAAWKSVTAELLSALDAVSPRGLHDRRAGERRRSDRRVDDAGAEGRERRSGMQRRMRERRKGRDRREPFADEEP